ncbi:MAG: DMT family transporter [Pseudomonadota bacterium]
MATASQAYAQPYRSARVGILCALGASTFFSLNDVLIKALSGGYPLHQIVFTRALVALCLTMIFILPFEGGLRALHTRRPFAHALRGFLVVVANTTFFAGIAAMALADVTALFFAAPLFITALSVVILREPVGARRWAAVLVGLLGVIVTVRPGDNGVTWIAVLPIVAAAAYAGVQIMTRAMGLTERASTMAMFIQMTFVCVAGTLGLSFGDGRFLAWADGNPTLEFFLRPWTWPPSQDWAALFGLGACSALGGYLISQAYRGTEAALIAPFEYTSLVLAVIFSITVFSEFPPATTYLGIALIAGSGVYVALREAKLGRPTPAAKRTAGRR